MPRFSAMSAILFLFVTSTLTSAAPSIDPVTMATTSSPSTNITKSEREDYWLTLIHLTIGLFATFTSATPSVKPVTMATTESSSTITTERVCEYDLTSPTPIILQPLEPNREDQYNDIFDIVKRSASPIWEEDMDLYFNPSDDYADFYDYDNEVIDAMACRVGEVLDGEECVRGPTNISSVEQNGPTSCPRGYVFDGEKCELDPMNCPPLYIEEDGKCVRDPCYLHIQIILEEPEMENSMLSEIPRCRCRRGYHFSIRRDRCIRCGRRGVARRNRCGC